MRAKKITDLFVFPNNSIEDAIRCIDQNLDGISLVVDPDHKLVGTITDGDIRRAIMAGLNLQTPLSELLKNRANTPYPEPITALLSESTDNLIRIMRERSIHQIPLINEEGQVEDLVTINELLPQEIIPIQAVIMAGGYGTRMRPLTESLPKPLLPVGNRPLMELIIEQLKQSGVNQVSVTTHFQAEKIVEYFGDGSEWGVNITYITEDQPLGTAGSLGLIHNSNQPLLVINGDILTKLDFQSMFSFHQRNSADMTVAVRRYDLQVPYGVLECEDNTVKKVREKPSIYFLVNAGIYLIEPTFREYIPENGRFDMTDLIETLIDNRRKVTSFPVVEYWMDIGQLSDYQQAQNDLENGRFPS